MGGGGPEVMQVMQQIAASIGSYSEGQAASAPASAADILEGASKEFLVRPTHSFPLTLPPSQLTYCFSQAALQATLLLAWTSAAVMVWMTRS